MKPIDKDIVILGQPISPVLPVLALGAGAAAVYFFLIKPKEEKEEKEIRPVTPTVPATATDIFSQAKKFGSWGWINQKEPVPKKLLDKTRIKYFRYHYLGGKKGAKNYVWLGLELTGRKIPKEIRSSIYQLIPALALAEGNSTEPIINKNDWRLTKYSWLRLSGNIIRHILYVFPKFRTRDYYAGERKGKKWNIAGTLLYKWLANDFSDDLKQDGVVITEKDDKMYLAKNILKNNYYNFMFGAALLEEVRTDKYNWVWTVAKWKTLKDRGTTQLNKLEERVAVGTFGKDWWDKKLKKYLSRIFRKNGILDIIA